MMLQFTQAGSAWACEFEVTDKINLHIENAEGILLYQRTAAGKFALIKDAPTSTGPVFDYDLEGLVYPKHIRVICSSLPTYAEVVSDGEITEIKSQTKEVEITANGTTQVAPDAGFSYLTGVTVKTNVPQSGGSGEGGGSGLKYYDAANSDSMTKPILLGLASIVKLYNNEWVIAPASVSLELGFEAINKATAFGVDWSMEMITFGERTTTKQFFESVGLSIDSLTEITKEEFYTI